MKKFFTLPNILFTLFFCFMSNGYLFARQYPLSLLITIPLLLAIYIFAGFKTLKTKRLRLRICYHGSILLTIFAASLPVTLIYHAVLLFRTVPNDWTIFLWSTLYCILLNTVLFWIGILCVYCTSLQLGLELRVKALLCGMIPAWNLIMLRKIIVTTMNEIKVEVDKEHLNAKRKDEKICQTKYPILLVHGVFFRDSRLLNYWGRIPAELKANGATVYYGEHQSAASVADSAEELAKRIRRLTEDTGCEKVNVIAHSKGGLDCRYALSELGIAPYVASLTTVNTPHRGCLFVDWLLKYAPKIIKQKIADTYNKTLRKLGDENPDFIAAVTDLTADACQKRNDVLSVPEGVYCQSIGSIQNKATSGKFPLNYSYHLVKYFDGPNDGLVGESSFAWGENYRLITVKGDRGVSHGDVIDMNRSNLPEFDVREFYVELVNDLKNKGL